MEQEHHHPERVTKLPRAYVNAAYISNLIIIQVRDANGKAVELLKDHEKAMHLIIISSDLKTFFHVHPIETISGDFEAQLELSPGRYLVIADVSPVSLFYTIEPILVTVGEAANITEINWEELAGNDSRTKEIRGKLVTIQHPNLIAGESATLSFDLHGATPLPYLGDLGHVIMLDEHGKRFIYAHSSSRRPAEFQVQFPFPGFYKLWAEFHFADAGILAFPFIVEVA